jgi:hypothetical protein
VVTRRIEDERILQTRGELVSIVTFTITWHKRGRGYKANTGPARKG